MTRLIVEGEAKYRYLENKQHMFRGNVLIRDEPRTFQSYFSVKSDSAKTYPSSFPLLFSNAPDSLEKLKGLIVEYFGKWELMALEDFTFSSEPNVTA